MQAKPVTTQHFEAPKEPKLTPEQQRMEKLWGDVANPPRDKWNNYPDDDQ